MAEQHGVLAPPGRKIFELTNEQREIVVIRLLEQVHHGQLPRGSIKNMADLFHVSRQTISTIWNKYINARANGNESLSAVHKKKNMRLGNLKYDIHALGDALRDIPYARRGTIGGKTKYDLDSTGQRVEPF